MTERTGIRGRLAEITGGASLLPLLVLFGLNLVDEFDQVATGVLAPEIRDTFGLSDAAFATIVATAGAIVILLIVPVGFLADRYRRTRLVSIAAVAWGSMSVLTGVSGFLGIVALLVVARFGSGLGRVMNEPVHASLLSDYYPPEAQGRVFSLHRMANPLGLQLVLVAGVLGDVLGWQLTFVLIAIPTFFLILLALRLHEPLRGETVDPVLAAEEEERGEWVPLGEAYRRLAAIQTLKRSWVSGFFLGAVVVPITTFFSFFYEQVYGLGPGPWGRAGVISVYGAGAAIGLWVGSRVATRTIVSGDTPRLALLAGLSLGGAGVGLLGMSVSPWIGFSILFSFLLGIPGAGFLSYHLPLVASVAPPRLRSQAFGYFGLFFGLGAVVLTPFVASVGDQYGYRWGIGLLSTGVIVAAFIYASASRFVSRDIAQATSSLAVQKHLRDELASADERALLVCRGLEVAYDQVQVLFGVDFEARRGEILALLGTNGAGKSTVLKAISGLVDPIGGVVFFDGRDITHADAKQTTELGVIQMPGGRAVFPTLSVAEHLRAAGWLYRDDPQYLDAAVAEVYETFPRLDERRENLAGNLSGGEQQMLALGMAFIAKPKLLMIDELSLGLAPTIVEQLLRIVRRIRDEGTTIILVEQSVNVALTVAERAYFLEKGEVRFEGPTTDLLERGDILRSVFLEGATQAELGDGDRSETAHDVVLSVDGLTRRFGGITAVDDVAFELRDGEILGLIGPNGAGKTTIFDLVSGYLTKDAGRITLLGEDVSDVSPERRSWLGLGRSFQDARLVPSLTVAENLALALERHLEIRDHVAAAMGLPGVRLQEQDVAWTVADLVELMGLGAFRDKFVSELSTGSRRIVDLAMCIAHDPKVLLLDEPSSGIAQRETEALGPLLRRIQRETGCSMLVIEHDMPLITGISDEIIALDLGRVVTRGEPADVVRHPDVVHSYLGGDVTAIQRSGSTDGSKRRKGRASRSRAETGS